MSVSDPVKAAWQQSVSEAALPPLAQVRKGAHAFHRTIRRRNLIEYAAGALVVVLFGAMALLVPLPGIRIGSILVIAGTLVVMWQLHRRAAAAPPPDAVAAHPILVHQREQFARQRDALESVALWYLGPLVPGMIAVMLAPVFSKGPRALLHMPLGSILTVGITIAMFGGIWWLNHRGARALGRAVDEIDVLLGEGK